MPLVSIDTVTFHFVDDPSNARTHTIVDGDADARAGTISAHSPVGEALLGACVGDDVDIYLPQGIRTAIVDRIERDRIQLGPPPGVQVSRDQGSDRAAPKQGRPPAPSQSPDAPATIAPYRMWTQKRLPDPRGAGTAEIASHLREIIGVEGPIRVQRAYRIYALACGINRVGRTVRSQLNKAINSLERQGTILLEHEGPEDGLIAAIARVTGSPRVVVRTPGGRHFWDVPPSELAAVIKIEASKRFLGVDELYHRVLRHYEIMRLTSNIRAELQRVLDDL